MKTAIVYDRVNKWGGAERLLLALHEMFPDAPLYTSVYDQKGAPWAKVFPKIYTTFIQKIPFASRLHELFGWLMPLAFEQFNFNKYDLVISVTSEAAKGILTSTKTFHLCICLTPTRYLWSGYDEYFKNPLLKFISLPIIKYLKSWDKIASQRPDKLVAISTEVKERVKRYYSIDSEIIFPPVEIRDETERTKTKKYYLLVSRLVSYKKVDLAIRSFDKIKRPLVIIGTGREYPKLKFISSKKIKFIRSVSDSVLDDYYKNAAALIMPQYEDFGLVSIEAQSFGIPVIAFNKGGSKDTVIDGKTGVLFNEQTVKSLTSAIAKFEKMRFNHKYIINNAKRFSKAIFQKRLQEALVRSYSSRWWGNKTLA